MRRISLIALAVLAPFAAAAQSRCFAPDMWTVKDVAEGVAEVWYSNSACNNSDALDMTYTTKQGIEVRVVVTIDGDREGDRRERLQVFPLTPGFMAFPPEAYITDGEEVTIQVMGGMA